MPTVQISQSGECYNMPMNHTITPKDFFLHLGVTAALYVSMIALLNLAFTVLDRLMPDNLYTVWSAGAIAWPISVLLVMVPALYLAEWLVARDLAKNPLKRQVWIRQWRIDLTLFLSGAVMIVDLIVLINWYLNGELSGRFIFKVAAVMIVAAVVFAYYLLERLPVGTHVGRLPQILRWLGVALVIVTMAGGFLLVGSPAKQRALRFDRQRTTDLTNIQWQIIGYRERTGDLPPNLAALDDTISGFTVPTDPATDGVYGYARKSSLDFELCATFDLASANTPGSVTDNNWQHPAGRSCFERSIDPTKYPVDQTK